MSIDVNELRKLIREVKQKKLSEYGQYNQPTEKEAALQHVPQNVGGSPPPEEEDYRQHLDGQLTDEQKAASFDDMFQNIKILLETWRERDPNTVAGKYFHDLLHLAKTYDPSYFPASDIVDTITNDEQM